jgi:hypothetical protein
MTNEAKLSMTEFKPLSLEELEAGLNTIRQSPANEGSLAMIVRRPEIDRRETLDVGELDTAEGLVGDSWKTRGSKRTTNGSSHPDMQLTLINARLIGLIAQVKERWPLAGDQLVVDLDLSVDNLPPGTRLALGTAIIEITAQAHTGCDKFAARFGREALQWVNSPAGKQLRLRGLNAKVVQAGVTRVGDVVKKV